MAKYYAVKKGKKTGIYLKWDDCKQQVMGFSGAIYKSFPTKEEAEAFLGATGYTKKNANDKGTENGFPTIEDVLEGKEKDAAVAYVDGSYHIGTKKFSFGAVIAYQGEEYRFAEKLEDEELATMRNVAGEIKGSECAMKFALEHNCKKIYIYHDYEGIARWCLGDWKTNKEGTKAYKEFYLETAKKVDICFVKVKGHSGDKYNDVADELAKKAVGII